MKTIKLYISLLVIALCAVSFSSCEDHDPIVRKSDCTITSITARGSATGTEYTGAIDDDQIVFNIPSSESSTVDITKLYVTANLPIEAIISPSLTGLKDLSSPYNVTVTAGDGTKKTYTLLAQFVN
jgi:hypothetical protein